MFGIGGFELFIILVFGFLIFGPDKLPEIAKTVGKGIAKFREAQQDMNETLGGEKIFDPNNPDEPFKNPVEVLDKLAARQEEKRSGKTSASTASASARPSDAPGSQASEPKPASQSAPAATGASRQESFTERKARYERERAARKAAEQQASADGGASSKADGRDGGPDDGAQTALAARLEQEGASSNGSAPVRDRQAAPARGGE